MKNAVICIIFILLLSGCGSKPTQPVSNDVTPVSSKSVEAETKPQYDKPYFWSLICDYDFSIQGIRKKYEDEYLMYMYDGKISDINESYIIAEGYLTDGYLNTIDPVIVRYDYSKEGILCGRLVDMEQVCQLQPAIPFDLDLMYSENFKIISDSFSLPLTKENFPSIELVDDWKDLYTYDGHVIYTDANGNKWITDEADIGWTFFGYNGNQIGNKTTWEWSFNVTYTGVVPYQ